MKLPRRNFLQLAAGAAALPAGSRFAWAQAYPSRPVRIIVGFAAGGSADILARLMGQWLSERLGQPFVIENRPGAGSNIGTEAIVRAPPDGYTLLLASSANAIAATLYDRLNFDFTRDIAPVAGVARYSNLMGLHPSFPAKTVPEFIAYAKTNPAKINMGSGGNGGVSHVSGELFKMMTGVNMVHVRPDRAARWAGAGGIRRRVLLNRAHQGGQAACPGSDYHVAFGSAAGHSDCCRIRAGLRGEHLARHRRAQKHIRRNCRKAQQRNQGGSRRSQHESAAR